jgi:adenylate kinase
MRVVIAGIPGVGKSTVLDLVKKRITYEVINFGTLMFEMARELNLVKERDEIRKLPLPTQINLQKKASSSIGKINDVIVDTHLSIKSHGGYFPGLPEWVIRELNVMAFFVIEAEPEVILKRRMNDESRVRDNDTVETIREYQEVNRYYAAAYSIYTGASVFFMENVQGKPDILADNIVERLSPHV